MKSINQRFSTIKLGTRLVPRSLGKGVNSKLRILNSELPSNQQPTTNNQQLYPRIQHPASSIQRHTTRAFTMVEIALALAIVALGLVAVIGVLPNLLTTSRQAIEYSALAIDAQRFVEEGFFPNLTPAGTLPSLANLLLVRPAAGPGTYFCPDPAIPAPANSFFADIQLAYDGGTWICDDGTTPIAGIVPYGAALANDGNSLLQRVRITYRWPREPPGGPPPLNQQTFTFVTEIAATREIPLAP